MRRMAVLAALLLAACGSGDTPDSPDAAPDTPDATPDTPDAVPDTPDANLDIDSDGDGVPDAYEGTGDPDGDGLPSNLDDDSDGDGIPDAVEGPAGSRPPNDSDRDGVYDFLDLDSDNDGLTDGEEDLNGNGALDPGESDPHQTDTDGDGYPDIVERAAGTDAQDPASFPDPSAPYLLLGLFEPEQTVDVSFSTDAAPATVDVHVATTRDEQGFITGITPGEMLGVSPGTPVTFTFHGYNDTVDHTGVAQLFVTEHDLVDATGAVLDHKTIYVVVPSAPLPP